MGQPKIELSEILIAVRSWIGRDGIKTSPVILPSRLGLQSWIEALEFAICKEELVGGQTESAPDNLAWPSESEIESHIKTHLRSAVETISLARDKALHAIHKINTAHSIIEDRDKIPVRQYKSKLWQSMDTAPKDGTVIVIRFVDDDDKARLAYEGKAMYSPFVWVRYADKIQIDGFPIQWREVTLAEGGNA
jgi:hypothetical protein